MAQTLEAVNWLKGRRVALVGRLVSMTRSEAARLISAHGGICADVLTREPTVVVVGRDGWPLAKDGRPTRKLRKALRLVEEGCDLEVVPEEELLARLHCPRGSLQRHSTLRELAQLLGISTERLEHWTRAGLVEPVANVEGIRYFDFCQVAGAKSLCDLVRSGITTARLRQSLQQLRKWLGTIEHPLAQLTTLEHGRQLVVRLDSGQLAEPTGQLLFDFSPEQAMHPASLPWTNEHRSAEEWFALASQAEEAGDLNEAVRAYRESLMAGGPNVDACFNLANVFYSLGQYARAGERYRQALELDPQLWEAWNNLAGVLAYEEQHEEALVAYRQALRLHPTYADAHYNIADTLEELGRTDQAREHWETYLQLEPHGAWAEHAKERLRRSCGRS